MISRFTLARKGEVPFSTWGVLYDPAGAPLCKMLERGAFNPDHTRIPARAYPIVRKPFGMSEFDQSFRELLGSTYKGILLLEDVPGRSNIEIHTANFVSQLLGCLATGTGIVQQDDGNFSIVAGGSRPAYRHAYPIISAAIDNGGAQLVITDPEGTTP